MKKNNFLYIIAASLVVVTAFAVSGCRQETIFYQIEHETELEDAVIKGSVFSIVGFKDKIYATDGRIYAKDKDVIRGWAEGVSPRSNTDPYSSVIIKLAADTTNLYALAAERQQKASDEKLVLFYSPDAITWTQVTDWTAAKDSVNTIFSDNAGKAYMRQKIKSGETETITFFILNGSGRTVTTDVSSYVIDASGPKTYTLNSEGKIIVKGTTAPAVALDTVYALSYSPITTSLYAGTSEGVKKLALNADGTLKGETEVMPGSNIGSTLKSYEAFAVYATEYTINGTSYEAIYATTVAKGSSYANINGLWGYYASRGTWNRE